MMRFLHTADWQIGMKARSLGSAAPRLRDERLVSAKRVVQAAKEHAAEFMVLAGDIFEDNGIDRLLVQKTTDILAGFPGPVLILPGNHDPLAPGSVWEHPSWKATENLHVLRDEHPVALPGCTIFPCPLREKHSMRVPTAWIPAGSDGGIRIGIAHGSVEGAGVEEPDYPIPVDAPMRAGLDYLALGHWHSYASYPAADGSHRMAYSGTHETTKFGERASGNVLLVEIAAPGSPPAITPIRTGGLAWHVVEEAIHVPGDVVRLRQRIEQMENRENSLIDVRISGVLAADERAEVDRIRELIAARFLMSRLDASRLHAAPGDENWLSCLPPGLMQEAAKRLREKSAAGGDEAEASTRALAELYSAVQEAQQ